MEHKMEKNQEDQGFEGGCADQLTTGKVDDYGQSLYMPNMEHDACGVGFVAHLKGERSFKVIDDAITMLENMEHRGATGFEPNTGDGAGILFQIPHDLLSSACKKQGFELPNVGKYGVGMVFFPSDYKVREECRKLIADNIEKFGFDLLGYRVVPTNNKDLGQGALSAEPKMEQLFIKPQYDDQNLDALERRLYVFRQFININLRKKVAGSEHFYIATLSYKTIVYKGQLTAGQLRNYFPDLEDRRMNSAFAIIHSRFSTNTFPMWKLAHPFRFIAHNGEINTIKGNVNWNKSYETLFRSSHFTKEEIELLLPLLDENQSDSANLDKIIELLVLGGRPISHVMMMLIPEAWENDSLMEGYKKAFYQFHSALIQPWDGPASITFTDGNLVGACLDRNGLRPSRYCLTEDNYLIMASEAGALPVDQSKIIQKGRLEPGKIFVADLKQGRIISDEEIKKEICSQKPYADWLKDNSLHIDNVPMPAKPTYKEYPQTLIQRLQAFGYTSEDLKVLISPMFNGGKEPIGSMGADIPLAVLSEQSRNFSHYFKQLFAQVSNPPMDSTRERNVMSLYTSVGKTLDILDAKPAHCRAVTFDHPVLSNEQVDKVRNISHPYFKCKTLNAVFVADSKEGRLEEAIEKICQDAEDAIRYGCYNILLISDRAIDINHAPVPSILAVSAVHQHLIKTGLRVRVGLLVEAGDVFESHHFATIIGYGGNAINPYMAFESLSELKADKLVDENISAEKAVDNFAHAINEGLLKIFAKMGISTLRSYHGAQIFEIIGLNHRVVEKCFTGSVSRIGGIDFDDIAHEVLVRHQVAFAETPNPKQDLEVGGLFQWKRRGEFHLMNPDTIQLLQQAVRTGDYQLYKKYAALINDQKEHPCTIRSLFDFKRRRSILIEEVEPVENILKRFATGAMSFGSISYEAHTTLAIAMNRIGGKSNSGEGGEDPIRYKLLENGDNLCSAIKQVASGRFGVTSHYLTNAKELQIKVAQGAKPGEGGQLPGHKVNDWVARVRHSTPGVGLISPPPHHDIYSIEDLAQLIFDLKNANRSANISVKLVSEAGVGTIAAGVAKAQADLILISGGDGGTGAAPYGSIGHTGLPWELGLAEAHQTLVRNNLRSRVTLQVDGQLRTGRDLVIAAMLGAEEWGIATAALIAEGCIMMRKCHNNTCPVGVATQDPELRAKFNGKPEHVINFFTFLANDLREIMAELGFHTINEMVGQSDNLRVRQNLNYRKLKNLDLSKILYKPSVDKTIGLFKQMKQKDLLVDVLDNKLVELAKSAITNGTKVYAEFPIVNVDRAVGTLLSHEITKVHQEKGLPDGKIHFKFTGSAGQSFGAFSVKGVKLELEGEANDYFGKGLSGSTLIVYPPKESKFNPHDNVIAGNVAFYGATSGEAYIYGKAGQRFCVRNSGAKVVAEGVGDHGCEYMTGGVALILGITGKNFAAGMSGGVAYVYNEDGKFGQRCNMELVLFDEMTTADKKEIKEMLKKHKEYTGSTTAEIILGNFETEIKRFVKVMPFDYKAVLEKLAKKEEPQKVEELSK
jgi:glutamate synthase (NADPH) large chain